MKQRRVFKICKGQWSITGVALIFPTILQAKVYLLKNFNY